MRVPPIHPDRFRRWRPVVIFVLIYGAGWLWVLTASLGRER